MQHPLHTYQTNAAPVLHGHQPRLAGLEKRRSKPVLLPQDTHLTVEPKLGLPTYKTNGRFVHSEFLQYRDAQDCQTRTVVQALCVGGRCCVEFTMRCSHRRC